MDMKQSKKNRLLFILGIAYAIVIPYALLAEESRHNVICCALTIGLSIAIYLGVVFLALKKMAYIQSFVNHHDLKYQAGHVWPRWLYQHRWPLGIAAWILLTLLQIHGSSIGIYSKTLEVPELDTAVIGFSRPDRFDEWLNLTSFAFSQYVAGPNGAFPYFNTFMRAVPTDMFIILGQPCWDICTIFRPFMLGYLFLPPGNGLAFFWMGRLILLALISYEFSRLWTKDNRRISWFYTLMLVLSPAVQWWFAVNEFVEMLIAGQAAIIVIQKYLLCRNHWHQLGWALLFSYLAVMYGFVMYPAWQIPFAYIFLVFCCWIFKEYRHVHSWGRWDILCGCLIAIGITLPVLHTLHMSSEAIGLLQASEYPGKRFTIGGGITWDWLFNSGLGLFFPFSGLTSPQLAFNMTQFFDFAPLGMVLSLFHMVRKRKADFLLCGLLFLNIVFMVFCLVPLPRVLVVGTLLFQVPEARLIIATSYINVILLLRVFVVWPEKISGRMTLVLAVIITGFSAWASFHYCPDTYFINNVVVLVLVTFIGIVLFCQRPHFLGPYLLGVFLCIGGMINPIAHGVSSVYDTDLAREISNITAVDQSRWLVVDDDNTLLNNYPPIFGAPTINSYNTYVAWENWDKLNLNEEERKAVNRCAHFKITEITEDASTFHSEHGDLAEITLSREDVQHLEVRYIMTSYLDLQPLNTDEIKFEPLAWANGHIIYRVNYKGET